MTSKWDRFCSTFRYVKSLAECKHTSDVLTKKPAINNDTELVMSNKNTEVRNKMYSTGNPISELRSVTCHMGSHSVSCHPTQVNAHRLTPAMQAGTRFTYPGGIEGWVDLVDLIAPRQGVEPPTFRSRVRRGTAAPPRLTNTLLSLASTYMAIGVFVLL